MDPTPTTDADASTGAVEQSRDETRVGAGAACDILGDAVIETATTDDGRYVIYYSWPDDV